MKPRGPIGAPVYIGTPAPLFRDDLGALAQKGRATTSIQRMRASHHKIARYLAHGLDQKEVAALTGYSRERVVQLAGSPAMKELVASYMEKIELREADILDQYLELKMQNMIAAERHIADHFDELDEKDELLPVRTALAVSADGADRLGYGKHQTNTNINVDFAAALERAIQRSGKVIDSVPTRPQPRLVPPTQSKPTPTAASARPLILRRA